MVYLSRCEKPLHSNVQCLLRYSGSLVRNHISRKRSPQPNLLLSYLSPPDLCQSNPDTRRKYIVLVSYSKTGQKTGFRELVKVLLMLSFLHRTESYQQKKPGKDIC
jgi:hypothetical protein